jgi:hypothetical protein
MPHVDNKQIQMFQVYILFAPLSSYGQYQCHKQQKNLFLLDSSCRLNSADFPNVGLNMFKKNCRWLALFNTLYWYVNDPFRPFKSIIMTVPTLLISRTWDWMRNMSKKERKCRGLALFGTHYWYVNISFPLFKLIILTYLTFEHDRKPTIPCCEFEFQISCLGLQC